ncbi:hypothetical protein HYPGJ_20253 [Hyphomicrobium sp. GJ21]|nr:hypothetical protein HYPGJ_20253 [Hyphomicrobium sp. GJ21]
MCDDIIIYGNLFSETIALITAEGLASKLSLLQMEQKNDP